MWLWLWLWQYHTCGRVTGTTRYMYNRKDWTWIITMSERMLKFVS